MQLIEHYAQLYRRLLPRLQGMEAEVTLSELAGWLHCTDRNVKLLLRGMRMQNWIAWQPGRGRGHHSRLILLAEHDELLLSFGSRLIQEGRLQEAIGLIERAELSGRGRQRFHTLLQEKLGYRKEGTDGAAAAEVLRFPAYRTLGSLDPAFVTRRTELHMVRQLFDTLVVYDRASGRCVPGLAHHWEELPPRDGEGPSWRFYLQKHVMFHHGLPFTANDAARTLERLCNEGEGSPYRQLFAPLLSVACPDEHLLILRLKHPYPPLLSMLSSACASIVPAERADDFAWHPVGTGPFRIARREERLLALEAFPEYYGRAAHLDRVEMWYIPGIYEGQVRQEEDELSPLNFRHYREEGGPWNGEGWQEVQNTDRGCKYILMNTHKNGRLQHHPHREAIHRAVRRMSEHEEASTATEGNRGPLAGRFILDLESGNEDAPSPAAPALPSGGRPLKLLTYAGAGHERDAELLKQALARDGITIEINLVPYEQIVSGTPVEEADLFLLEQPVDEDEEWTLLTILANPHAPVRRCLPASVVKEIDPLLDGLTTEPSRSRRLALLQEAEQAVLHSHTVVLWYRWRQSAAFPPGLRGVSINSFGWVDYKNLWFAGPTKL